MRQHGVLWFLLTMGGLLLFACGQSQATTGGSSREAATEKAPTAQPTPSLDPSEYEYVLSVRYEMRDDEVVLDKADLVYRGTISVDAQGKLSIKGTLKLKGKFVCPNKDIESDTEYVDAGTYTGTGPFFATGRILTPEEVEREISNLDTIPLVDLTTGEEISSLWIAFSFPDMNTLPKVSDAGMDTGQCFRGYKEPISPQHAMSIGALIKGDRGAEFDQIFYYELSGINAQTQWTRVFETEHPEVIQEAKFCLAKPGGACE